MWSKSPRPLPGLPRSALGRANRPGAPDERREFRPRGIAVSLEKPFSQVVRFAESPVPVGSAGHQQAVFFAELNEIRARDGVPYTHCGKSNVDEGYFSSVVDGLDEAVMTATGKSAHCHSELYV